MLCVTGPCFGNNWVKDTCSEEPGPSCNCTWKVQKTAEIGISGYLGSPTWSPDIVDPPNHDQHITCGQNFILCEKMKPSSKILTRERSLPCNQNHSKPLPQCSDFLCISLPLSLFLGQLPVSVLRKMALFPLGCAEGQEGKRQSPWAVSIPTHCC